MKRLAVILISLVTAIGGITPAQALPSAPAVPKIQTQSADVVQVQDRRYWRDGRRGWRGDRGYWRDRDRYSGRYYRHRSRDRGNAAAIIGGLAAGAIIGGALAAPRAAPAPRYTGGGNAHTNWCYGRYRSYDAYSNTFQPYNGPRRQCYSPYR